jgi:hypothetical protein
MTSEDLLSLGFYLFLLTRIGIDAYGSAMELEVENLLRCRPCAAGFAEKRQDLFVLFELCVGTPANRADDSVLEVSLYEGCKCLFVRPAHEYGPSVFERCVDRELAAEIIQKFIRISPQKVRKLHVVQPECFLS